MNKHLPLAATDAQGNRSLKALNTFESRYRRLFETARDGILLLNADTAQIEDVNPYLIEMLGYSHEEFLGKKLWEVGSFSDRTESKEMFAELQAKGYVRYEDLPLKTKAGARIEVEFISNSYECEGIKVIQCNVRNISKRKAAEAKLQRHQNLYVALSQCNKTIVHCVSQEELFQQVCRAAVQFGAMKMAWVGLLDTDTSRVRPAASFGDATGFLNDIDINADADSPFGRGPTATAIREETPYWCQDYMNSPATIAWREAAAKAGFASSAALPLYRGGIVIGAFTLYSGETNAFDAAACDLLVEMATDISFALDNFARECQRKRVAEDMKFKNSMLLTQQETSLDAILIVDEKVKITSFNQQFVELWGLSPQIVRAREVAPLLQSVAVQLENSEAFVTQVHYLNKNRDEKSRDELQLKDGRVIDRYSAPVTGSDGKYYGRIWYFRDITERKNAEARIKYLNRVHAMLSAINTLIVRVHDRDELFSQACRIVVEVGEFQMAMLVTIDPRTMQLNTVASVGKDEELRNMIKVRLSSVEDVSTTMVGMAIMEKQAIVSNDALHDSRAVFSTRYIDAGIRSFVVLPLIVSATAVGTISVYASEIDFFHEDEMKLLTELADNVAFATDHLDKQERLNYLAYYDALTGLANRSLFLERVALYMRSAIRDGHKLALCLIDLERFKNINDSLGRPAGNALLKQVAQWLTVNLGDVNLLARIDADHFAMVLPEIRHEDDLIRLIEKMSQAFQEHHFRLNDSAFRIAIKGGIALFPDDGGDADMLFKNAEAALKKAKVTGDRYLFYTQKMTDAVAGKLTLENQLRQAIDNEEFVLYYQPKVNLASGNVTSAEALIRWNDPRNGLVPPGKFIPILEETGLINDVGSWALHKAIADNLRWRNAGLPALRIAVNVSAFQLHRHGFVAEIEQALAGDARAAEGLELEITESMLMEDIEHTISSLKAIRAMGITIAIDDFGTGFSSLSYLSRLPVDKLKIDRSFVIQMTEGSQGLALVSTIIKLAHAFKLKVVAEGVETEEQSHLLGLLDCDEMQGFLFSKAVPCEEFETKFLIPK